SAHPGHHRRQLPQRRRDPRRLLHWKTRCEVSQLLKQMESSRRKSSLRRNVHSSACNLERMNTATIAIPRRWEPAMAEIKRFVEHYAQLHNAPFNVVLTYHLDAGQIHLIDDTLTEFERQVCENA